MKKIITACIITCIIFSCYAHDEDIPIVIFVASNSLIEASITYSVNDTMVNQIVNLPFAKKVYAKKFSTVSISVDNECLFTQQAIDHGMTEPDLFMMILPNSISHSKFIRLPSYNKKETRISPYILSRWVW